MRPSYLYNGNPYANKTASLYIEQSSWGQHGAHLGPVGPRWAPCWPHEPWYQRLDTEAVLTPYRSASHEEDVGGNPFLVNGPIMSLVSHGKMPSRHFHLTAGHFLHCGPQLHVPSRWRCGQSNLTGLKRRDSTTGEVIKARHAVAAQNGLTGEV